MEQSFLILCPPSFPSLHTGHTSIAFCRAIACDNDAAVALREDAADVAAQFVGDSADKLMKVYKYAMYYYAVHGWRAEEAPHHGLLNFSALRNRFRENNAQLEKQQMRNARELRRATAAK